MSAGWLARWFGWVLVFVRVTRLVCVCVCACLLGRFDCDINPRRDVKCEERKAKSLTPVRLKSRAYENVVSYTYYAVALNSIRYCCTDVYVQASVCVCVYYTAAGLLDSLNEFCAPIYTRTLARTTNVGVGDMRSNRADCCCS